MEKNACSNQTSLYRTSFGTKDLNPEESVQKKKYAGSNQISLQQRPVRGLMKAAMNKYHFMIKKNDWYINTYYYHYDCCQNLLK